MVRIIFVSKKLLALVILVLLVFLISGEIVIADPSTGEPGERTKQERARIKAVEKKISGAEKQMVKIKVDEAAVIQEIEDLNLELNKSRATLRKIIHEMDILQSQIKTLDADKEALHEDIHMLETHAMQRLAAFYKLGKLGVAPIIFSAESFFDLWQRRDALGRVLDSDAKLWDRLQNQTELLDTLSRELTAKKIEQDRLLKECQEEKKTIAQSKKKRAELLEKIRKEKSLILASIESLKKAAKELDKTFGALEGEVKPPSARTGKKAGAFLALKGSLPMPVHGNLVEHFGYYMNKGPYNTKNFRSGVKIKADIDSPVRAVFDGQVIYASWFKGYGNMMIIDHGEHYYTLFAHLDQLLMEKGASVETGNIVGTVGDTAALGSPGLYFEIRHYGKPLNPVSWFKK